MRHKLRQLLGRAAIGAAAVTFLGLFSVAGPGIQHASASGPPAGLAPADLQSAYALPSATQGVGQTVAVVTPYDDATAETNLTAYRSQTGLPACTTANGCFKELNLSSDTPIPSTAGAQALDAVSAVCPNCHILLVDARSTNLADVGVAVDSAVALGAKFVVTTVVIPESQVGSTERTYDMHFNHPGVAITAPSGNSGFVAAGPMYPAASPYVVAVGGTVLTKDAGVPRGWDETSWASSGSGCSTVEPKPAWQVTSPDPGCDGRMVNDISAVATNVAYYKAGNWNVGSGTVISAAIIAAAYALAGTPANDTNPASYLYGNASGLTDLTSGPPNGTCAVPSWCTAGTGYDGPTGLGTPNGVSAFLAGYYQPITPTRFMDTRTGNGGFTGPLGSDSTVELAIAGQHGIPAANITAVALNLTALGQTGHGYITAWADGTPRPGTNNLDYPPSQNAAGLEIVPVGTDGVIDFYNASSGTVQLIADVSGYFTSDPTMPGNETFTPLTPVRILDTRGGIGAPQQPLANGVTLALQVAGANGIPANATAVAINFTAVNATAASWLKAYADGTSEPGVTGLQFPASLSVTGSAIVQVGAATGMIDIKAGFTTTNSVDVLGDVMGYFTAGTANETYHAIYPSRIFSTGTPIPAGGTQAVPVGNPVIAPSPALVAVIEARPQGTGHFVVYPSTVSMPGVSSVNFSGTTSLNNLNITATGNGAIDITNISNAANDANVDAQGYFSIG